MAGEGASPSILIVDMMIGVFVDLSNERKNRGVEIGCNASENLGGDAEGYWAANKGAAVLDSVSVKLCRSACFWEYPEELFSIKH